MTHQDQHPTRQRPFTVALTGGVASGKTMVSDAFAALGAAVIDTDVIAREVVTPGSAGFHAIVDAFGNDIVQQGEIDRGRLRRLIFASGEHRARLESILHPLIITETRLRMKAAGRAPYIVVVVPLLVGSPLVQEVDRILVVDADDDIRRLRLINRDGISETLATQMMAAQTGRAERLAIADDVIFNNGTTTELISQIQLLHDRYRQPGQYPDRVIQPDS